MNILLTNDDGFQSEGLQLLCQGLSDGGHNVYVVAPDGQRSAFSHAINFHRDVKFVALNEYFGATKAYTCSGTPGDCVKFGIMRFEVKFDLVISGPNDGENYGLDVLYSGTVGAAEEALICGVQAIAISRMNFGGRFEQCVDFMVKNVERLAKFRNTDVLLNINVPDLPSEQIKGIVVVPQGRNAYADRYEDMLNDNWKLVGSKLSGEATGVPSDVTMTNAGYITITPISIWQTDFESIDVVKELLK